MILLMGTYFLLVRLTQLFLLCAFCGNTEELQRSFPRIYGCTNESSKSRLGFQNSTFFNKQRSFFWNVVVIPTYLDIRETIQNANNVTYISDEAASILEMLFAFLLDLG